MAAISPPFTGAMKRTHTILMPSLLYHHSRLLPAAFAHAGYRLVVLEASGGAVDARALAHVHNDLCYPAVVDAGQVLEALSSGRYDVARVAVLMPQTGGGCRVGCFHAVLCKALRDAGYGQVPVISLDPADQPNQPGFVYTPALVRACLAAFCYGDLLMMLTQQTRPYTLEPGAADTLEDRWIAALSDRLARGEGLRRQARRKAYREILTAYAALPCDRSRRCPRIGVTGEVFTKFCAQGNGYLERLLDAYGCECRMGGFADYAIYIAEGVQNKLARRHPAAGRACSLVLRAMQAQQRDLIDEMAAFPPFVPPAGFAALRRKAEGLVSDSFHMGDGWLTAAETALLIEQGCPDVVCIQPFACLVSHIGCRGMLRPVRRRYSQARLHSIEFDSGLRKAGRESRLLSAIQTAREQQTTDV